MYHKNDQHWYYLLCIFYVLSSRNILFLSWDSILFFDELFLIFTKTCIQLNFEAWNKEYKF